MISRLKHSGLIFNTNSTITINKTLNNMTFAITGKLNSFSRTEIENIIRENGGSTTRNITKQTNFLILGDSPGSKLDDAKILGVDAAPNAVLKALKKGIPAFPALFNENVAKLINREY